MEAPILPTPESYHTHSWDVDPLPQPPLKLRLMCSYGGHIIPRPHDKTLCYIGGDTRIIVIDRHISLSDLRHRLSKTLLQNQSFSLKYQLPNEDLDSLISVTADEDLDNMVEEFDRLHSAGEGSKPDRLRLFLFPDTPSNNIEQLLMETASTKSDDWFFNALNGKGSALSTAASDRGFSDSSSVNHLLGLDDDFVGKMAKEDEAQMEGSKSGAEFDACGNGNNNGIINQDVHSVPDSPILETSSSFGSTSSSLSAPNLPPIKVHVEDNPPKVGGLGIEDQFQQLSVGVTPQKQEEVGEFGRVVSRVPMVMIGGEYPNRLISDDERSDHGWYNNAHQIQHQIPLIHQKQTGAFDLPSPDSVSSEGSVRNPLSRHRQAMYQEPITQMQSANTKVTGNQVDQKTGDQNNTKVQMQPLVQESSYVLSGQYNQNHPQLHHHPQQFVQLGNQFIPAGAMPVASYYPIYRPQQQHQPVYFMPARPPQGYSIPVQQPNYSEPGSAVPSSHPGTPQAALATYNQGINVPTSKPEMTYTAVQIPYGQHQPQYVGYTQIQLPSQPMTPTPPLSANSTGEFADPSYAHMYYARKMPPQYHNQISAPAATLSDSAHLHKENSKQQQQQQLRALHQ